MRNRNIRSLANVMCRFVENAISMPLSKLPLGWLPLCLESAGRESAGRGSLERSFERLDARLAESLEYGLRKFVSGVHCILASKPKAAVTANGTIVRTTDASYLRLQRLDSRQRIDSLRLSQTRPSKSSFHSVLQRVFG